MCRSACAALCSLRRNMEDGQSVCWFTHLHNINICWQDEPLGNALASTGSSLVWTKAVNSCRWLHVPPSGSCRPPEISRHVRQRSSTGVSSLLAQHITALLAVPMAAPLFQSAAHLRRQLAALHLWLATPAAAAASGLAPCLHAMCGGRGIGPEAYALKIKRRVLANTRERCKQPALCCALRAAHGSLAFIPCLPMAGSRALPLERRAHMRVQRLA